MTARESDTIVMGIVMGIVLIVVVAFFFTMLHVIFTVYGAAALYIKLNAPTEIMP